MDLGRLYPGLEPLGRIVVPTADYTIHPVSDHLQAADFNESCLRKARPESAWAYLGPGNWGPDAWLILFSAADQQQPVCVFLQSKKRSDVLAEYHRQYPEAALGADAGKCCSVKGEPSCLLNLTDERGRGQDNEPLHTEKGIDVVTVSRGSYLHTYGVAMESLKRCREALEYPNKKPRI